MLDRVFDPAPSAPAPFGVFRPGYEALLRDGPRKQDIPPAEIQGEDRASNTRTIRRLSVFMRLQLPRSAHRPAHLRQSSAGSVDLHPRVLLVIIAILIGALVAMYFG
jgi:hypothetical protein